MIAGYAKAAEVFKEKAYRDAAAKAADFLLTKMRTDNPLSTYPRLRETVS